MQAKIKSLHLENFGKHSEAIGGKPLDIQLGQRTIISGCNKTGKSTIKRSIQYIFGCKDENGKEIAGIRPHDENGVDIDRLTTVAEMTLSVDGVENTLKKTYFQKKNRQGEYTGEDNTQYFIDGVRKNTRKSYDEFIQTILPDPVCMSAQEFFKQDTAGRRNLLETTFSNHTTDEIIDQNPEFEELRGKLRANSVSDLKSACNERINGKGRGANHVDGLNDKLTKLKHQIEFELSKKVEIDVVELGVQKNSLNEQIAENKAKRDDVSKEFEERQRASDGVIELKFELNDLQRKANEENNKKRSELENKILQKKFLVSKTQKTIEETERDISETKKKVDQSSKRLSELRQLYTETQERVFDENSLICSYCGQELPDGRKEELKAKFEKNKQDELAEITNEGNRRKSDAETEKETLRTLDLELSEHKKSLEMLNNAIADLEKQLSELPESIDISDRPEVQEIQRQISKKEQAMNKGNSAEEIRQQLKDEENSLRNKVYAIDCELVGAKKNAEIDKTVEELKVKQRNVSQEIANVERELDLLKQFDRKKAEFLENDVNSNFEFVKIRMFERQANSELKDACRITVDGESYDRNLNHGAKILAEIGICRAFQKANNVCLPIIVDDCESLDDWRVPNIENQLIIIKRSDDKELKIEVEG